MSTEYFDTDDSEFHDALVGRRIVRIDADQHAFELDDGTVVQFIEMYDCCAWFAPLRTTAGDLVDNIITDVRHSWSQVPDADEDSYGYYDVVFMCEDQQIASVAVEGDITSGYYMEVGVVKVKKREQRKPSRLSRFAASLTAGR